MSPKTVMKTAAAFLTLAVLLFASSSPALAALSAADLAGYVRLMKESVINFSTEDTEPLDAADLEGYSVYLVGEMHATGKNTDIQLAFIKYLNKNFGVRLILQEEGYCNTIALNKFLKTGDRALLDKLFESFKGSYAYTEEEYGFYIKLYEYNRSLPEDRRLTLAGADVQHQFWEGLHIIRPYLGTSANKPEAIGAVAKTINKTRLTAAELRAALDTVEQNRPLFENYLGGDYQDFFLALRSVWQSAAYYETGDLAVREGFIRENARDIYSLFGAGGCFGMFGGAHAELNGMVGEGKSLANWLGTEFAPTKGKVLSIMCMYDNCFYMDSETGEPVYALGRYSEELSGVLAQAVTGGLGLCSTEDIQFNNAPLGEKFQYMLCVKGSPASRVYGD